MHRRTLLTTAAGVAAAALVPVTSAAAHPTTGPVRPPLTPLGPSGWPSDARATAISTGGSGTWLGGNLQTVDGYGHVELRRLGANRWVPAPTVPAFDVELTALAADATGVWVVGDRNEATLPNPDGATAIVHLTRSGARRQLDTAALPQWLQVRDVRAVGDGVRIVGGAPSEDGSRLLAYSARWAKGRWITEAIHGEDSGFTEADLRMADSSSTIAVSADAWCSFSGGRWTRHDAPLPGTGLAEAAVAKDGSLWAVSDDDTAPWVLHRTGSQWDMIGLPGGFAPMGVIRARAGGVWVRAARIADDSWDAAVFRVNGTKVVERRDSPWRDSLYEGLVDLEDGLLSYGAHGVPGDEEAGWVGGSAWVR